MERLRASLEGWPEIGEVGRQHRRAPDVGPDAPLRLVEARAGDIALCDGHGAPPLPRSRRASSSRRSSAGSFRPRARTPDGKVWRPEEHKSELQSLMRTSYAVSCLTQTKLYLISTYASYRYRIHYNL